METVSRSGLLLWDRTALKSVRSGLVPVPWSGLASLSESFLVYGSIDTSSICVAVGTKREV
jgi:hypothetical protein